MKSKIYISIILAFSLENFCNAQSGTTDLTFGIQGQVTNEIYPTSTVLARAVMATSDRVYTFAQVTNPIAPPYDSYLKCFLLDGSIDASVGTNGIVTFPSFNGYDAAVSVDLGAIYSVGSSGLLGNGFVFRYDITTQVLSLDSIVSEPNHNYLPSKISPMDNGQLMVSGSYFDVLTNTHAYRLARLNDDLTLDTSYGQNGLVTMPLEMTSATNSGGIYDMEVDHLGNTYVLGNFSDTQVLNKINNQGVVDLSFTPAPEVDASSPIRAYQDLTIALDNSLYIVPAQTTGNVPNYVIKLNNDGSLSTSFANNGIFSTQITEPGYFINFNNIVVQQDGDVIITAHYNSQSTVYAAGKYLIKLSENGVPDVNFQSTANLFNYNNGSNYQLWLFNTALQPDGKILCFDQVVNWISDVEVDLDVMLTRFNNEEFVKVEENFSNKWITAYPNPTSDVLHFNFQNASSSPCFIKIFDSTGKCVINEKLQSTSINVEHLQSGFYNCEVQQNNTSETLRFVKL